MIEHLWIKSVITYVIKLESHFLTNHLYFLLIRQKSLPCSRKNCKALSPEDFFFSCGGKLKETALPLTSQVCIAVLCKTEMIKKGKSWETQLRRVCFHSVMLGDWSSVFFCCEKRRLVIQVLIWHGMSLACSRIAVCV